MQTNPVKMKSRITAESWARRQADAATPLTILPDDMPVVTSVGLCVKTVVHIGLGAADGSDIPIACACCDSVVDTVIHQYRRRRECLRCARRVTAHALRSAIDRVAS